ncbi:MAG: VWA domain-containing protein [Actinomyces sp.]|uniref:vWA domain-containing protein n=1 Tax=Actinomyces sp. TaxID=29317 RepID=UPI0026DBFD56|nr:VWA domain-containing protein [Actinomyces sp.]MDO4243958.1 VWA domain-containing protein [Actinomyces sp.]
MTFEPLHGWILVLVVAAAGAAALTVSARWLLRRDADPGARSTWWRRTALCCVLVLLLAGPSLPTHEKVAVSNIEIFLVVDRTGSMAAEDWAGGPQAGGIRLDGVKQDLTAIKDAYPTASFSIIALDSSAARELPLTTDLSAVSSWIDSLSQEVTARSSGSSLERALPLLTTTLDSAARTTPENARLVYILSDGEATDDGAGAAEASGAGLSWTALEPLVDGGAVLGYGTPEGGRMREFTGSGQSADQPYIQDPTTDQDAVSVPDTALLESVAQDLGVTYLQRTGGPDDAPSSDFTDQDVDAVLSDGRQRRRARQYLTWPLGLAGAGLLLWEAVALARADRGLWDLSRATTAAVRKGGMR